MTLARVNNGRAGKPSHPTAFTLMEGVETGGDVGAISPHPAPARLGIGMAEAGAADLKQMLAPQSRPGHNNKPMLAVLRPAAPCVANT